MNRFDVLRGAGVAEVRGALARVVLACAILGGFGCEPETHEERVCGEHGSLVAVSGETVCVYRQDIVIETGFSCPAELSFQQEFMFGAVCSGSGRLSPSELEQIAEWAIERGWGITPGDNRDDRYIPDNPEQIDILWVIDNSFSMCQEQRVLRDSFGVFVDQLIDGRKDFHIGVTTTHAPESEFVIEPLAREAFIQSTPQPVPGNYEPCIRGDGVVGGAQTEFAPFREALELAKSCLAESSMAREFVWSDEQIACALQGSSQQESTDCVASTGLLDRDGSGDVDVFDLFPDSADYRAIPRVLERRDYRDGQGQVDRERLIADFRCMASVGTRGDGYEKGLRVAARAVSPEYTGGAAGLPSADRSAPNHGLIRAEADFALIFLTDENDCSHDGSMTELGNICGNNVCEYYNSTAVNEADSPLISPEFFAVQLRENLAATKGLGVADVPDSKLFVGSIHGTSARNTMPFPTCGAGTNPDIEPVCASELGEAFSGDRYERFARQFERYFPSMSTTEETRLDFTVKEFGWMCSDTFEPALELIGFELAKP